jgi:hypothetical protein
METYVTFLGAQQPQSNNTKCEGLANPTFFRDALYIGFSKFIKGKCQFLENVILSLKIRFLIYLHLEA